MSTLETCPFCSVSLINGKLSIVDHAALDHNKCVDHINHRVPIGICRLENAQYQAISRSIDECDDGLQALTANIKGCTFEFDVETDDDGVAYNLLTSSPTDCEFLSGMQEATQIHVEMLYSGLNGMTDDSYVQHLDMIGTYDESIDVCSAGAFIVDPLPAIGNESIDFLSMLNGVVGLFIILCALFGIVCANRTDQEQVHDKHMDESDDSEKQGML